MNGKQLALSAVLIAFMALTLEALYQYGFVGLFEAIFSSLPATLCLVDLTIALSLALIWMARDAKDTGISPLPYMLLTIGFGSAGVLLYLIRREGLVTAQAGRVARAAV